MSVADRLWLARAVELAERGLFSVTENPRVGCLIVRDGKVLGRGTTHPLGGLHAETDALADACEDVRGATAYVSLEPCCHHGRQPPCTDALISAGISRVVAAMRDPNPRVSGEGFAALIAAGIEVDVVELDAAKALNEGFARRMRGERPYVRVKMGISIDGRTAVASGESQWITSSAARSDVQYYRARSGAVVTGIGTVLADDPSLNVREERFARYGVIRQPIRAVLDREGRLPGGAKLFDSPGRVVVFTRAGHDHARAEVVELATVEPGVVVDELAKMGCNEILVEAGAGVAGAFLEARVFDEVIVYVAPKFLGHEGRAMVPWSIERLEHALTARIASAETIGDDVKVVLTP